MTYWFRVLITFFWSLSKKKTSLGENFVIPFRILPQECGMRFMFNATAPALFELARLDWMIRSKIFAFVMKEKFYTPLASLAITYHRPISRFQKIEIHSKITGFDDKWFYFRHDIFSGGKVYISAVGSGIFKKGRETIAPLDIINKVGGSQFPFATEKDRELVRRLEQPSS